MLIFTCQSCRSPVYFDNFACVKCGAKLAYIPELGSMSALELEGEEAGLDTRYRLLLPEARGRIVRMCRNAVEHGACNWTVAEDEDYTYCRACRLNAVIPDLSNPVMRDGWLNLEAAKRRLLYSLLRMELPVESRHEQPENGLQFSFLADTETQKVFTGHSDGLITINVSEADAPFREKLRKQLGEGYRTLLGHFRHEIGHYYWDRLVRDTVWHAPFRALFGNEELDYCAAVERHYAEGAPANYMESFVSAYATMHPWEDFAETWAHYMHIMDTLETAQSYGLALRLNPQGALPAEPVHVQQVDQRDFEAVLNAWFPLTLAINGINRSMGMPDPYPFVLSEPAVEKLRFVHHVVAHARVDEESRALAAQAWERRSGTVPPAPTPNENTKMEDAADAAGASGAASASDAAPEPPSEESSATEAPSSGAAPESDARTQAASDAPIPLDRAS